MEKFCQLGSLPGTPHQRFGIVRGGYVVQILISRPEGKEVPPPGRFRIEGPAWNMTPEYMNPQQYVFSKKVNGEQPRRPTWRRAGRTVNATLQGE